MHEVHSRYRKPKSRSKRGASRNLAKARLALSERPEPATRVQQTCEAGTQTEEHGRTSSKFGRFREQDVETTTNEYLFVHSTSLQELASHFPCEYCKQRSLHAVFTERKGSAAKMIMKCRLCDEIAAQIYTSQRVHDEKSSRPPFDINRKLVEAFVSTGAGHAAMSRFSSIVGTQVMDSKTYTKHLGKIHGVARCMKEETLKQSREAVRKSYQQMDSSVGDSDVIDLAVSFDGSWHRRGFVSLYGFASVIEITTGLIIDYTVLSKYCHMCIISASELIEDSPEFLVWQEGHIQSGECNINYSGSSPGMEAEAAVRLCARSIKTGNFRYESILGDGDGKSVSAINKAQPYGIDFIVQKEECVNHISKRLGTAMRELVKKSKGLGGRGAGTLTQSVMQRLQRYYQKAVIENVPHEDKMKNAILATLHHSASSDQSSMHQFCPEGETSWCFYQRGIAQEVPLRQHKHDMSMKLNTTVFDALKPIYERLSSTELLKRCARGATSNANEALHSAIWKKCPKTVFMSKGRLEIGIAQAISEFNMGCTASLSLKASLSGGTLPTVSKVVTARLDKKRKRQSDEQAKVKTKINRAVKKRAKRSKESKEDKKSGKTYVPGGGD